MVATVVLAIAVAGVSDLVHHGNQPLAGRGRTPRSDADAHRRSTLVTAIPAVAVAPHERAVLTLLNHYFSAINHHDYAAFRQLVRPVARGQLSSAAFAAKYRTTTDSRATVQAITVQRSGRIKVAVTYISHQRSAASAARTRCTAWHATLYLVRRSGQYELTAPVPRYARATACT